MARLGDVVSDTNGNKYKLLKKLGKGGQAAVCQVQEIGSNKLYAYKSYRANKNNIRNNIEDLIKLGSLNDKDGNALNSVVLPLKIVPGENDAFGYIMECVDLKDYTTLKKAWSKPNMLYPKCDALCKIIRHLAEFFEALHGSNGMCYKDINEGNIFFNPKTGDIKIIDNDNIGYSNNITIKGTPNYMAPEVVLGKRNPDQRTDSFSLAVYVFRLLTGGYPFDGEYSRTYTIKNDMLDLDAARVIYGKDPVFIWHPTDKRNSIEHVSDDDFKMQARYQADRWKKLVPQALKDLFISTFVTNLPEQRRAERASDAKWLKNIKELESTLRKCPNCNQKTFAESEYCFNCESKIGTVNIIVPPNPGLKQPKPSTNRLTIKHIVAGKLICEGESKKNINFAEGKFKGKEISKHLPEGELFEIVYYPAKSAIGIKNTGNISWFVMKPDGTSVPCPPGKQVKAEANVKIAFIRKKVQFNIESIN